MNLVHPRRRIASAVLLFLLGCCATGVAAAPAGASGASPAAASITRYAVEKPLCAAPTDPLAMRCFGVRRVPASRNTPGAIAYTVAPDLTHGPAGGYTPADLASAYGFDPTAARSSQLVAVVNWFRDPNVSSDLDTFDAHYGLPKETATSFRVVSQTGGSTSTIKPDTGSAGEQSLDVESIRGVCHSCRIVLVEARTGTDADIAAAENEAAALGATEIDNSFGEPEQPLAASVVAAYNHPGVVITASTGDDGWYGWDGALSQNGTADQVPSFPATSPYVVSVGGTELAIGTSGRDDEIIWNENGHEGQQAGGATGGGCSTMFAAPAWQLHQAGYAAAGCNGKRLAADVSAIADPQLGFDVYNTYGASGWVTIGGTSLAAPVTAAMFALAGGSGGAPYPAASLYANANAYPASVFDVTAHGQYVGGNGYCGGDSTLTCGNDTYTASNGRTYNPNGLGAGNIDCSFTRDAASPAVPPALSSECNAVTGYDGPTGVGTPTSLRLFTHTNPSVAITRPASVRLRGAAVYTARVSEPITGTTVTSYAWTWGDGTSTTTTSAAPRHAYARAGTFTIRLTVSDSRYQRSTASTSVTVGRPASVRIGGPASLHRARAGTFSARAASPNTGARITRVTWSWGDRSSTVASSAKHSWARTGTYTVTVAVQDSTGVTTTATRRVKVVR